MISLKKGKLKIQNDTVNIDADIIFFLALVGLLVSAFIGCAVSPVRVTTEPAFAEQRRVIAEQRERIAEMERVIVSVQGDLERATSRVARIEQGNTELEAWFGAVDEFVTDVIRAKHALEQICGGD